MNNFCTGCGACKNICIKNSIELKPDKDGFYFPVKKLELCNACDLCKKVCPVNNHIFKNEDYIKKYYAVAASDNIRAESASGGVFTLAANYVLENKGAVCGVRFSENYLTANHCIIEKHEELFTLKSSKYLQSNTLSVYREILSILNENRYILFVGTPCQVAGLKNYLILKEKNYDKLITIDLLCHAVPSPKVWEYYLKEIINIYINNNYEDKVICINVKNVNHRAKTNGWNPNTEIKIEFEIEFENGNKITDCISGYKKSNDPYFSLFLKYNAINNKACYDCNYATLNRCGDLTIGDLWGGGEGINEFITGINDGKGLSAVIINNKKGETFFNKINNKDIMVCKESKTIGKQKTINSGWKETYARTLFFNIFNNEKNVHKTFEQLEKYKGKDKFDTGIVGWYYSGNMGDVITTWALNYYLQSIGKLVLMVSDPYLKECEFSPIQKRNFLSVRKYYIMSDYLSLENLNEINNICGNFIVAGGQLFRNMFLKKRIDFYQLNFASKESKKIAIGTSFATDRFEEDDLNKINILRSNFKGFNNFFTREDSGVKILNDTFQIKSTKIMDPLFFNTSDVYKMLSDNSKIKKSSKKYLFIYFLNINKKRIELLKKISDYINIETVYFVPTRNEELDKHYNKIYRFKNFGIEPVIGVIHDWLNYINNCEMIITDSFHTACLSIIFNKKFLVINTNNDTKCRFDILNDLGLQNKLIDDSAELNVYIEKLMEPVEWNIINQIIKEKVDKDKTEIEKYI
jgi:coenzyme F420-reducing hydrogenase beta subunit